MTRALVVGCGPRVWQELEAARAMCRWDAYYVINRAGIHWPHGRFSWVTLHPELMPEFARDRAARGLHCEYEIVIPLHSEVSASAAYDHRRVSYIWERRRGPCSGSSGLYAIKVALHDGHERVVLVGMPMTPEPSFYDPAPWTCCKAFYPAWKIHQHYYRNQTRSLSGGWTEQLLGCPTSEWLGGDDESRHIERTRDEDSRRCRSVSVGA